MLNVAAPSDSFDGRAGHDLAVAHNDAEVLEPGRQQMQFNFEECRKFARKCATRYGTPLKT